MENEIEKSNIEINRKVEYLIKKIDSLEQQNQYQFQVLSEEINLLKQKKQNLEEKISIYQEREKYKRNSWFIRDISYFYIIVAIVIYYIIVAIVILTMNLEYWSPAARVLFSFIAGFFAVVSLEFFMRNFRNSMNRR